MSKWLEAAKRASGVVDSQPEPNRSKPVLSVVSVLSEGERANPGPSGNERSNVETSSATANLDMFGRGGSVAGHQLTSTGCVVSLDEWRILTAWERHGPVGRHWFGINREWKEPEET